MHEIIRQLYGLDGKLALVTGSTRGIGREIARVLAAAGATVLINGRSASACEATCRSLCEAGLDARAQPADLGDEAQIEALFESIAAHSNGLDILVNCAGSFPKFDFLETTREQWDGLQQINLRAPFVCMQKAIKQMRHHARGGRIINVSSVS